MDPQIWTARGIGVWATLRESGEDHDSIFDDISEISDTSTNAIGTSLINIKEIKANNNCIS